MVAALPATLTAQMTISGLVRTAAGLPVEGAVVGIPALDVDTRTTADGTYNFLIRAALVRGQTAALIARHARLGQQAVDIRIVGGSLVQDFVLQGAGPTRPVSPRGDTGSARADSATRRLAIALLDSTTLGTEAGIDLPSALAARRASLTVAAAAMPGGSSSMLYRGARSLSNTVEPLVVVDGVAVDNTGFTTPAQRFGLGGFDYGAALSDIAVEDIERVELLDPVTASLRYGSRAANGVIEVATKTGRGLTGFSWSIDQHFAAAAPTRLPEFQDAFGQGLGGAFEFFDGQGGGVNDAVQESWGPRLDAQPVAQHSMTEPRRPEVRYWLPQPDDTRDYFERARVWETNVAVQGSHGASHLRAALNASLASALTPGHQARRLGVILAGGRQLSPNLSATAHLQIITTGAEQRPGTGFDEVNPVAGFTRMGRQVDLDGLRSNVVDENGAQINWIYTNRNNPFFATTLSSNDDERRHVLGGLSLSYRVAPWLTATVRGATDDWNDTRRIAVADAWLGGFPSTLGRADFSGGGSDDNTLGAVERLLSAALEARGTSTMGLAWSGAVGGEMRGASFQSRAAVTDRSAAGAATVSSMDLTSDHDVTSFFGTISATRGDLLTLRGGARIEQTSSGPASSSVVYPSAEITYDAARAGAERLGLGEARLFARYWQAGNEITRRTFSGMYFPGAAQTPAFDVARPERTAGVEVGARISSVAARLAFDVIGYRERSTDVLVLAPNGDGTVFISQSGEIFNGGIETSLRVRLLGDPAAVPSRAFSWDLAGSFARNASTVDRLGSGTAGTGIFAVPLSPALFGARMFAEIGGPAGVILGSRQLRNANGELLLRDGLPIADASAPFSVLGSVHPDWTVTMSNVVRFREVELFLLADARRGGRIFSATNLWGSYAGTLESTLIGDRAPGAAMGDSLTIAGIDSLSGVANTTQVSAEQYFHSLGSISEPWVYDASYTRLREARLSYTMSTQFLPGFRQHRLRLSVIGRNLLTWSNVPNIDPEGTLAAGLFRGFEMGRMPGRRTLAIAIDLTP